MYPGSAQSLAAIELLEALPEQGYTLILADVLEPRMMASSD
jgi:hypothetical protein